MRLRICHPKARHIMCAYLLPESEKFGNSGACDDGEHGAAMKILSYMLEKRLESRAIFVARYYNGIKIGPSRFKCILEAVESCINKHLIQPKKPAKPSGPANSANHHPQNANPQHAENPSTPTSPVARQQSTRGRPDSRGSQQPPKGASTNRGTTTPRGFPNNRGGGSRGRGRGSNSSMYRRGRGNYIRNRTALRGGNPRASYSGAMNSHGKRRRSFSPNFQHKQQRSTNPQTPTDEQWDQNYPPPLNSTSKSPDLTKTLQLIQQKQASK